MKSLFLSISLGSLFFACEGKKQTTNTATTAPAAAQATTAAIQDSKTYFVLTSWTTSDRAKAMEHVPNQQKQLMSLWNKGLVENIYYNQNAKFKDGEPLPLIAFFANGANEFDVRTMLDSTDIVIHNLATYTLREVGRKIFLRSRNAANLTAGTAIESYAVVWTLTGDRSKMDTTSFTAQAIMTARLQDVGILENIYVDLSPLGTKASAINPAVFIINSKDKAGAKKVLDEMPIVKSKKATYGLYDVGQYFMGTKDE